MENHVNKILENLHFQIKIIFCTKGLNEYSFYWWRICWTVITPLLILALIGWSWTEAGIPLENELEIPFPDWTVALGQMLSVSSLIGIIGWMAYEVINALFFDKKSLISIIKPSKEWRPLLNENNQKVIDAHKLGKYHTSDIEMNFDQSNPKF